jgi:hypothetical protein
MLTGGADCIQNHEGLYRITYMKMPAVWSSAVEATRHRNPVHSEYVYRAGFVDGVSF